MDSNQKFWLGVWVIVAVTILALVAGGQLYYNAQSDKVVAMVKNGADPIKAMCSIYGYGTDGRTAVCAMAATPRFPNEY